MTFSAVAKEFSPQEYARLHTAIEAFAALLERRADHHRDQAEDDWDYGYAAASRAAAQQLREILNEK